VTLLKASTSSPPKRDDEATLVNQDSTAQGLSTLLDTGDYDISVSLDRAPWTDNDNATDALENESDIGSLIISERSTDDMQLWRTTADVRDDVVDAAGDENEAPRRRYHQRRRGRRRDRDGHGRTR